MYTPLVAVAQENDQKSRTYTYSSVNYDLSHSSLRYSLFGLLGNLGPIASGQTTVAVRNWLTKGRGLSEEKAFESSVKVMMLFMFLPLKYY